MARFGPAGPLPLGGAGPEVLLEVRPAQTVRFTENFIKAKLENAPNLVGAGQVITSLRGPAAGPWARGRSGAMVPGPIGPKLGRKVTLMGRRSQ